MSIELEKIFGTNKPLIGMIHFPPLIGYEGYPGLEYIVEKMLKEAQILENGGVDAIMVENNYDLPHAEFVPAEVTSMMTVLTNMICENSNLPVGISTLWNDYKTSLGICGATSANFFRVPAFVDSVKTSYGDMLARADEVVDYRNKLGLDDSVAILADVQVKHSEMIEKDKPIETSTKEAIEKGADGVIVTGKWTGDAPDTEQLEQVRTAAGNFPVIIGSGANSENIPILKKYVDGIIVGTALKEGDSKSKEEEVNLKPFEYTLSESRVLDIVNIYNNVENEH